MFSTTLTALALSTVLASGIPTPTTWQPNYRSAVIRAATDKKPLAVFLVKDEATVKAISSDALDKLKREYVAVIVNTETESGKKLAASFEMTEGLVISDRTGEKQAFRHVGSIPTTDLPSTLERFAHVSQVTATETQGVVVYAEPIAPAPVYSQAPAPVYYPQATRPTPIRNIVGATLNTVMFSGAAVIEPALLTAVARIVLRLLSAKIWLTDVVVPGTVWRKLPSPQLICQAVGL